MTAACECADPGCPFHLMTPCGSREYMTVLYRADTEDETGTAFCGACADEAHASGLYYEKERQQ